MGDSKRKRTDSEVDSSSENEKEVNIEAPSSSQAKKNSESEQFWELGSKKRVTLRSWKGSRLIDIREFYGEENDMKPGKKGISLNVQQFKALAAALPEISKLLDLE